MLLELSLEVGSLTRQCVKWSALESGHCYPAVPATGRGEYCHECRLTMLFFLKKKNGDAS